MTKTILINGFGTGISKAIAEKFGAEGYAVALVARNAERLAAGVQELEAKGVKAVAIPGDLSDVNGARDIVKRARAKLGPIGVVQWNAYGSGAGDLLASDPSDVQGPLNMAVTSLLAVVQEALADLRAAKGAVLVTNGGLGLPDQQIDAMAVQWKSMGLAIANAAKHKLVRLLAEQLKPDGVYVGEVMVLASVKGTAWDSGSATLEAATVADKFWEIYSDRRELSVKVG